MLFKLCLLWGVKTMARRTKPQREGSHDSKRKKFTDYRKTEWVLNNLEPEQLSDMDARDWSQGDLISFFDTAIARGLDIKVGWDDYSSCFKATAAGMWLGFANTGYATQGRSSDVGDALKILWYKCVVVCEWDLSAFSTGATEREIRG